ncbi:MAG: V-type ATP synthase subunit D [Firmicutes bacterium]|nr:V-type ATP synthase subunit D [Bacillota bacterium]
MAQNQINPTRIELRKCKTRLKSATAGHKLLKDKLDEMVRQFLTLARKAQQMRQEVESELLSIFKSFALARAIVGSQEIESALYMPTMSVAVQTATKSIMGVTVPIIKTKLPEQKASLPYALASAPPELDQAIFKFYDFVQKLIKLGESEKICALLAEEMEKTRRRVNALEYIMIPELKNSIQYIQMKLDENERAALVRLMKVKEKLEKED